MNSSNSDAYSIDKSFKQPDGKIYGKQKSKSFLCPCGRSYGSYPALYSHIKKKHDGTAPGSVVKPLALRKRGRPFKYEPIKLQNQNSHKTASKHLSQYLKNVQQSNQNQFPLKQFAYQQNHREPFGFDCPDQIKRSGNITPNNQGAPYELKYSFQPDAGLLQPEAMFQPVSQNVQKDLYAFPLKQNTSVNLPQMFYPIGYPLGHSGKNPFENKELGQNYLQRNYKNHENQKLRFINNQLPGSYQNNLNYQNNQNIAFNQNNQNIEHFNNNRQFQNINPQGKYFSNSNEKFSHFRLGMDPLQMIYEKPFEILLKRDMELKFKPIEQGLIQFLDPILREMLAEQPVQNEEKNQQVISLDDQSDWVQKQGENPNAHKKSQDQKYPLRQISGIGKEKASKKFQISSLFQKQHFHDILKWLMSSPQQQPVRRKKQNYIQFSFRCALVQFLDFTNRFLQTCQYQQVLLILIFFCDHILCVTGSFQFRPQPQIYQMASYFNQFMDEYMPKLITFMEELKGLFIFVEVRKKVSELFMWMGSWMAMQQYYHNRYYREIIKWEVEQDNLKAIMYQRNYQMYIKEGLGQMSSVGLGRTEVGKIGRVGAGLRGMIPLGQVIGKTNDSELNFDVQEKVQDEPEMRLLPNQGNGLKLVREEQDDEENQKDLSQIQPSDQSAQSVQQKQSLNQNQEPSLGNSSVLSGADRQSDQSGRQ